MPEYQPVEAEYAEPRSATDDLFLATMRREPEEPYRRP